MNSRRHRDSAPAVSSSIDGVDPGRKRLIYALVTIAGAISAVVTPSPVFAQPILDGALDPLYAQRGISTDYVTNIPGITASLHQIDDPALDPSNIYLLWEIGVGFVDNSYGTRRHSSWPAGHSFFDLAESDLQQLQLINVCGEDVIDAIMDYVDGPLGAGPTYTTPSFYDVNMDATESVKVFINGGDWSKFAYKTSIVYNLNDLGFCTGGDCSGSPPGDGTDLLVDSPPWADEPHYTPASPYDAWEYRSLYEMKVDRTVFQTPACIQGTPAAVGADPVQLHASPSKAADNKLILFRVSSAIGDYVWLDADRDGIQDAGEEGLANVTVALYTDPNGDGDFSDGTLVATTTTDSSGRYLFSKLGKGNYVVDVTDDNGVLTGFSITSGPETETDPSAAIVLPLEEENLDIDFGYAPTDTTTAVVGDYVWSDADQDGIQDPGESGISGVTVELRDAATGVLVDTTVTGPDGLYLFTSVAAGDYFVDVVDGAGTPLDGYTLTTGPQSQTDPSSAFQVAAGDVYLNADFGYFGALGSIGNQVFFDVDEDGVFDAGEPPFGNVTLSLLNDANGDGLWDSDGLDDTPGTADDELIIASTATGIDGTYSFDGLPLGADYLVTVTDVNHVLGSFLPSTFLPLTSTADNTGKFAPYAVSLTSGAPTNFTADFGYLLDNADALVGDRVWADTDGDGIQDATEPGIEGVTVLLYDDFHKDGTIDPARDEVIATRTTDINGNYFFTRLKFDTNGEGYIVVIAATNFGVINGRLDVNADGAVDGTDDGNLNGVTIIDGGLDMNGDGTIGAADDGIWGGAEVINGELDLDGDGIAGETNGDDSVTGPLATYTQTGDPDETGTCVSCDGQSGTVVSNSVRQDLTLDFGFDSIGTFEIGDTVYLDLDADGTQDGGEPGIEDVVIGLYRDLDGDGVIDVDEPLAAIDITDANGSYLFEGLVAGDYVVAILDDAGILVGYTQTQGDPTEPVTVGPSTLDVDFGFIRNLPSSIGNFVWEDLDGDGVQDAGEPGISGVVVNLYQDDGDGIPEPGGDDGSPVATTVTGAGGQYGFTVPSGSYFVQFVAPSGYVFTSQDQAADGVDSDADAVSGNTAVTLLAIGENDPTWDAGLYRPVAVGDRVWLDVDGNGVQDAGEPGLGGVTLRLFDAGVDGMPGGGDDVLIGTTATDFNGNYLFSGQVPGTYFVDLDETTLPGDLTLTGGTDPSSTATLLSGQSALDKDFGYFQQTTRVLVSEFSASIGSGGVHIRFETAAQEGTIGFFLYRWDTDLDDYVLVNDELLEAAVGSPQGASYELEDANASLAGRLIYALVEVEAGGTERTYGPFEVQPGEARYPNGLGGGGEAQARPRQLPTRATKRLEKARRGKMPNAGVARGSKTNVRPDRVKLTVQGEGLCYVSAGQLGAVFGLSANKISGLIHSRRLDLSTGGVEVAWFPADRAAGILFYASGVESPYTSDNVYWLELGRGLVMETVPGGYPTLGPIASFEDTVHFEEDVFAATVVGRELDIYYWAFISAGSPTYGTSILALQVEDPAMQAGETKVKLGLLGATSTPAVPDHLVRVSLNGIELGTSSWDGDSRHEPEFQVPAGVLLAGENTVEITGLRSEGVPYSAFLVDSVELTYRRQHRATADQLRFDAGGNPVVTLDGFSDSNVILVEISKPHRPRFVDDISILGAGPFSISFIPSSVDAEYLVAGSGAIRTPAAIEARQHSDLKGLSGAEYLVIAPRELRTGANHLAAYRAGYGLSTRVVELEEIYDEFAFGLETPEAIRDFLEFAYNTWPNPVRFAALVGAASFDYKDVEGLGDNLLPSLLTPTPYGLFASDSSFGDVEGADGVPEIAIGRIPVVSNEEMIAYVEKMAAGEHLGVGVGPERVVMLADNDDAAGAFSAGSDGLLPLIAQGVTTERIYLSEQTPGEARARLFAAVSEGVGLVNYVGHGGLDRFAGEGLLTAADAPNLEGDRLPVVTSMTCSVGRFEVPGWISLAEALVLEPDAGAVAIFAPSGQSVHREAMVLNEALFRAIFESQQPTIGEAMLEAVGQFGAVVNLDFMLRIYSLLGDPAYRIQ